MVADESLVTGKRKSKPRLNPRPQLHAQQLHKKQKRVLMPIYSKSQIPAQVERTKLEPEILSTTRSCLAVSFK
jgi:hypothetical protein